jgi:hypothetical protein
MATRPFHQPAPSVSALTAAPHARRRRAGGAVRPRAVHHWSRPRFAVTTAAQLAGATASMVHHLATRLAWMAMAWGQSGDWRRRTCEPGAGERASPRTAADLFLAQLQRRGGGASGAPSKRQMWRFTPL